MWSNSKRAVLLTAVLLMIGGGLANAQPYRGRFGGGRGHIYARSFYDPFWRPYAYPFGVYPYPAYGVYPFGARRDADVRVEVTPKQTEVFVDGFYAGVADDFDGVFKRLHTTPGGHAITLRLEGYRTVTENIYVSPDSTYKLRDTLQKLAAGETTEAPPFPLPPRSLDRR
jgi:PEGA domain-containing protein